ncbi:MAG: tRNA 2-thiouridine(34) synthase MnmA [Spirochaetaceae bacterium]|nr:tRNA 2-thiouridine(34) synthase MnmA [Spirochaetaceae bacterium]
MIVYSAVMDNSRTKVAVGLSGGVDSSLAAVMLVEAGYTVIGLTMKIWRGAYKIQEGLKHACFGPGEEEDIAACERMASKLGIEYHVIDLSDEYEHFVIDYFRDEYRAGRTPNPCIVCNKELKFGFLADRARKAGMEFDYFATGHYARTEKRGDITYLKQASNLAKDQSYFLYGLDSARLDRIMFPLGEMTKEEVRKLARAHELETAEKPESQDFVAGGDYAPLFESDQAKPGDIVDSSGKVLGRHRGLPYYTIGQRRGIGISAGTAALYVLSLDAEKNQVVVGPNEGLFSEGLLSRDFRFQDPRAIPGEIRGSAKIRQNHKPVPCSLSGSPEGIRVHFEIPQRAVAPGQSVVIYSADGLVLGGGIIDRALL